jgi:hypothetical protein
VELVVSATVVLASVLATVSVVDASSRAVVAGDRRRAASALATSEIEAMRVLSSDRLGFAPGTPGAEAAFEGRDTVWVPMGVVEPTTEVQRGSTRYQVRRWVSWEPVDAGGRVVREGVKHLTVEVRWGDRVVRQDSGVANSAEASCARRWTDAAVPVPAPNGFVAIAGAVDPGSTAIALDAPRSGPMPAPGDLLLLVQMTGRDAGRFEYALAGSGVDGGMLHVSGTGIGGGTVHGYLSDGSSAAQVVRVPTVARLQVDRLDPPPFDGRIGGVLAVDVTGDVVGPTVLDVEGRGASSVVSVGDGDGPLLAAGAGAPGAPGGGVVALRADAVVGPLEVRAGGAPGGGGGSVLLDVGSALVGSTVRATGGASPSGAGGPGGRVWSSTAPAVVDVAGGSGSPPGAEGSFDGHVQAEEVPGLQGSAGCLAALSVVKSTSTPVVATAGGGSATWTITVSNAADRGVATSLTVRDPLGPGVSYVATSAVQPSGGATRDEESDPEPFSSVPVWGSFTLPAGSSVAITFRVAVADGQQGTLGNDALVEAESGDLALHAGYSQSQSVDEDVQLRAFSCEQPWTDPDPGALSGPPNTYLPLTAAVPAGTAQLPVGPETGAVAVRPGDLLLVVQMTGAGAGRFEYVLVTAREQGRLGIEGLGPGGGLVGEYGGEGVAQVVRVPTFANLVLGATVRPPTWNGSIGGVLAVDVTGAVQALGGVLDVSGAGPVAQRGAGADGGLVLVRAASVTGTGASLRADGAPGGSAGGRGGTVAALSLTGTMQPMVLSARGGTTRRSPGGGGAVLVSGPAASIDVAAGGPGAAAGSVADGLRPRDTSGIGLGVGCRPVLQVAVSSPEPGVWRVRGASAPVVLSVSNLAGRPVVQHVSLSGRLPDGVEVWSTDAVELAGGAARPEGGDPPAGTTPEWGGFEVPGGATVTVHATLGFPGSAPGGVEVGASARGDGPVGTVAVSAVESAGYLLGQVVTARSPVSQRAGSLAITSPAGMWPAVTGPLPVDGGAVVSVATPSRLLPVAAVAVRPPPEHVRVAAVVAAELPGSQVCVHAEVFDLDGGALLAAGGGLGTVAAPAACVGPSPTTVELELPPLPWTGQGVDRLGVRWYLRSPQGAPGRVEGAWTAFDWQDGSWDLPATSVSGAVLGGDRADPLAASDGATMGIGGLPRRADGSSALDLATPLPVAGDAAMGSLVGSVVWRPVGGRVCLRAQWTLDGAPVGSPAAPVCRSSGGWSTERFVPTAVAVTDLGRLGLRLLPEAQGAAASLELDAVEAEVTWWRS